MPDLLAELRAAFPVGERWLYFNHAAVSPMSVPVAAAVEAFARDAVENGSVHFQAWADRRESARGQAARLLGCEPGEVAITTSTSQGLITVAEGLPLGPGDEILVVEDDFPANQIPWIRQERRGARVVTVPRRGGLVHEQDVLDRLTPATRLVALPFVLFDTGQRLDIEGLGQQIAGHEALFCVDAIQGLGAFPLDVERARIDFLSADSHKWMLGLEGMGLFYCRREHLERLDDPFFSWLSVDQPFAPYARGIPRRGDARRFEYASLPQVALPGLGACLDLLLKTGVERMGERILELTARLAAGLDARGWQLRSAMDDDDRRSGIVSALPAGADPMAVVDRLTEQGVSVAARGGGVRFSPHAWNTDEEVDRLLDLLA